MPSGAFAISPGIGLCEYEKFDQGLQDLEAAVGATRSVITAFARRAPIRFVVNSEILERLRSYRNSIEVS